MSPSLRPILALDAASPLMSVAIALQGRLLASREEPGGPSARPLVALLDEATASAGVAARELGGLLVVRGPGSFTGLRLALATAWALHESLSLPATAVTTFEALAWSVGEDEKTVLALVDALRGEWYAQRLSVGQRPVAAGEAAILPASALDELEADLAIGFGVSGLRAAIPRMPLREPGPLAPPLAIAWSRIPFPSTPETLLSPLYLRAPAPAVRLASEAEVGA